MLKMYNLMFKKIFNDYFSDFKTGIVKMRVDMAFLLTPTFQRSINYIPQFVIFVPAPIMVRVSQFTALKKIKV